jgi:hypothetical protein
MDISVVLPVSGHDEVDLILRYQDVLQVVVELDMYSKGVGDVRQCNSDSCRYGPMGVRHICCNHKCGLPSKGPPMHGSGAMREPRHQHHIRGSNIESRPIGWGTGALALCPRS